MHMLSSEQDPSIVSADCIDLRNAGMTASGVYQVNLNTDGTTPELTDVYCDMDTDNGGWLVRWHNNTPIINAK